MARQITYNIDVNASQGVATTGELEQRLTLLNQEISQVATNSSAFRSLSVEIQQTTAELERANVAIEGFTSQRRRMALQGSIDIFTGGITAFSGIAASLGIANENLDETVVQLLAVANTANGVRQITVGLSDLQEGLRGSAVAQRLLNAAANANPYVILATAVLAVGAALVGYAAFADDASEATDRARGSVEDLSGVIGDLGTIIGSSGFDEAYFNELGVIFDQVGSRFLDSNLNVLTAGQAAIRDFVLDDLGITVSQLNDLLAAGEEGRLEALREILLANIELAETDEERIAAAQRLIRVERQLEDQEKDRAQAARDRVDAQIGALADFANASAQVAEESKGLAVAAIITNAAVAGIGVWRQYFGDPGGPFGPVGNAIAAGAQLAVIAAGSAVAIDSVLNPEAAAGGVPSATSFTPGSATTAIPSASPVPQGTLADQMALAMSNNTVLLTPTSGPGSLQSTIDKNNNRESRRRLGG